MILKKEAVKSAPILIHESAPFTAKETMPMITPARMTPHMAAMLLFLKSMSRKLAASVPVQAPVPGSGIPTKRKRAK